MIALLAAATLALAPASPLLARPACAAGMLHTSGQPALLYRPQDRAAARLRKLGELPPARGEYAVMRMRDGCMIPALIGDHPGPSH